MNAQPLHEDDYYEEKRPSLFSRVRSMILGDEPEQDDYEQEEVDHEDKPSFMFRKQQSIRLDTARKGKVSFRKNAQLFEDAKAAADGLKKGEQQIINLERATPMMTEKIVDFLSGVCYALDGSSAKIGDRVFMFLPANVEMDADDIPAGTTQRRAQYE